MGNDDDLARLLPDPPPPRPARRDAAIAAAMRRFDGVAEPSAVPARASGGSWVWMRRGPIGAFASILLVALIAIPLALRMPLGQHAAPGEPPAASTAAPSPAPGPAPRAETASRAAPAAKPRTGAPVTTAAASPPAERAAAAPAANKAIAAPAPELAYRAEPAPAPAPAPVYAPEPVPTANQDVVVTGQRVRAADQFAAAPVTVVAKGNLDEAEDSAGDGIIVTGTARRQPKAAYRRGDWNACTVDDPGQTLRGCGHLVNPGAKGVAGVAGAHLADGLAAAWRQDWTGAIAAFDQAIALQPKLAFAYLNRGLAWRHEGDDARAAADLDNAVRYARHAARGYYQRGVQRRRKGDVRGAEADAARAASLDSRYAGLTE